MIRGRGRAAAVAVVAAVAVMAVAGAGSASAAPPLTFTSYTSHLPSGFPTPTDVAVGDLNGDGRPDIVVSAYNGALGIFMNEGNDAFTPAEVVNGSCFNGGASRVAIGHFTLSGHPDILVTCDWYTDGLLKYPGNGDGTFGAPVRIQPIQEYLGEDGARQPLWGDSSCSAASTAPSRTRRRLSGASGARAAARSSA